MLTHMCNPTGWALRSVRSESQEFKAILGHKASVRLGRTSWDPVCKQTRQMGWASGFSCSSFEKDDYWMKLQKNESVSFVIVGLFTRTKFKTIIFSCIPDLSVSMSWKLASHTREETYQCSVIKPLDTGEFTCYQMVCRVFFTVTYKWKIY